MEQAELVALAKTGDLRAFDELVRATYADAYTLAYRLTGNEEDARDVVQEAYLRAFKGAHRFRGDALFSTWLYRIVANCAATALTHRRRTCHDELNDDSPFFDDRPEADPMAMAEASNLRDRINVAMAKLPWRLRYVVLLRDVYDWPHAAIASQLGITEAAAKVRLHRARRKLREQLFPIPGEQEAANVG